MCPKTKREYTEKSPQRSRAKKTTASHARIRESNANSRDLATMHPRRLAHRMCCAQLVATEYKSPRDVEKKLCSTLPFFGKTQVAKIFKLLSRSCGLSRNSCIAIFAMLLSRKNNRYGKKKIFIFDV